MQPERQIAEHLERALMETMFAIAEYDYLCNAERSQGNSVQQDSLAGILLMLRSALDSALALTRTLAPAQTDYSLAAPDSSR
jgi:hypothetical protein